jgi:hypothetical protein
MREGKDKLEYRDQPLSLCWIVCTERPCALLNGCTNRETTNPPVFMHHSCTLTDVLLCLTCLFNSLGLRPGPCKLLNSLVM